MSERVLRRRSEPSPGTPSNSTESSTEQKFILLEVLDRRKNNGRRQGDGSLLSLVAMFGIDGLFFGILIGMSL